MSRLATRKPSVDLPLFGQSRPTPILRPSSKAAMSSADLISDLLNFREFGAETQEEVVGGIRYLANEFWTAGQRQAHSIHEISYRACFKAQLPGFFIERLTSVGEGILDPFMGRGTTLVQAALAGRRPMGNDINPLSILLTRPRLAPPNLADVSKRLNDVTWSRAGEIREDLLTFYSPSTLEKLCALREWLLREAPLDVGNPDPATDWIRMVAINRLTGHSPGFFSVYTLPPNQATSIVNQRKINEKRSQTPPPRDVIKIILKKTNDLLKDGVPPFHPIALMGTGPSSQLGHIPSASASLVVTSPPFLDIVHYAQDNWLRCWFAGIDVANVKVAMHRTEEAWQTMVTETLSELARVVRPGGHVAFEVGEVRGGKVLLEQAVWRAAEQLPFERLAVMINQQEFTKTANCWGVANNSKGTNTNRIVILRRQ